MTPKVHRLNTLYKHENHLALPFCSGKTVAEPGRLYVAGGFDGIRDLASAEVYDPRSGGSWGVPRGQLRQLRQLRMG